MTASAAATRSIWLPTFQDAGSRIGPFTAANYAEDLTVGRGYEWNVPGRVFLIAHWRSASSNNQGLWRCGQGAATGWGLITGNTRDFRLFFRPSALSTVIGPPIFLGLNVTVFRVVDATGFSRVTSNGSPAVDCAIPAAYVAAGASAIHSWGKWQSEAGFAAIGSSILQLAIIDGYDSAGVTSDASIEYLSGANNQLHRWHARPEVMVHPRLLMGINAPDWSGVAGSDYAALGSGGSIFRMQGTGGGKTAMQAFRRSRIPQRARFGCALDRPYEDGSKCYSIFSEARLTSSAVDVTAGPAGLVVEQYGKNLGIVGNAESGIRVNGTNLIGNNIQTELNGFDTVMACDVPGIVAGAAKPIVLTEGLQSIVIATDEIRPNASPQFVRVPAIADIVFGDAYAAVADVDIYDHDSLMCQISGITGVAAIKGPAIDAAIQLQKTAMGARRVVSKGIGGRTFKSLIGDGPAALTEWLRHLRGLAVGTASNRFRFMMTTNDFDFNTYLLQTTFRADLVTAITAILGFGVPGTKVQLIGSTSRTSAGTPNASGWVLADFSTSQSAAVATIADARVTYVDAVAAVTAPNRPDGLHWNPAGHIEMSNFLTANQPP